jgi:2-oxo-4-hydroxy-4-carboxy-5-ureidoimidazoline decarboxylase
MPYTLDQLNAMTEADFVAAIGPAFEDTPSIAAQVWAQRPFASVADLHQRMVAIVRTRTPADQLTLINAHPDLGTRVAMATASISEQSKAGLTSLTAEEYHQFQALNQQYKAKFGFPFILAVAGHTRTSILENFIDRLRNSTDVEKTTALLEIEKIALARLNSWIVPTKPPENMVNAT